MIEPLAIEVAGTLPVHRVFTLLFVPATFLVAGISGAAIGAGLRRRGLALRLLRTARPRGRRTGALTRVCDNPRMSVSTASRRRALRPVQSSVRCTR